MEISIEPWKKLVIHEVVEYTFDDFVYQTMESVQATGTGIRILNWASGVAFQAHVFPDTDAIIQEKLNGTIHYASVTFAIKEKFEKQVIKDNATINFVDASINEIFNQMATKLKEQSKYKSSSNP
ncbi:MAG: hypothetical protein IIA19_09480 [Thaumarchaeota archaeon]|nr:hypothetical protein [Nitrososphaerota archaeon]